MASIRSEYQRFLQDLGNHNLSDDARRLAFLIYDHLDTLAEVGAARRARSSRLAPLAVQHLPTVALHRETEAHRVDDSTLSFRLQSLVVGPFRGFMVSETFDLSHDITLVYGANGTGKSSFCEALETAMLGTISEAQAKRLEHAQYCNNARLRRHNKPQLTITLGDSSTSLLTPNEAEYRFCFIEKNRLDDFARIAARTPGDQRLLIATLFGIDQFSEFVRGFNQSLDESLMLTGAKALALKTKREQLATSDQVTKAYPDKLRAQENSEAETAEAILPGHPYPTACAWLLGDNESVGRLATVQAELDQPAPSLHGVTQALLQELQAAQARALGLVNQDSLKLGQRANDVSFAQMYEAVVALSEGATACPACGTDLTQVHENPFERAARGLQELKELSLLQKSLRSHQAQYSEATRALRSEIARAIAAAEKFCSDELRLAALPPFVDGAPDNWFADWERGQPSAWSRLLAVVGALERVDAKTRRVMEERNALVTERQKLDTLRLSVERLRTQRKTLEDDFRAAQAVIEQFAEANKKLIDEVEEEKPVVQLHARVKAAYDSLLPRLQAYLACLPAQLLQGLNEQARTLYNAFNRGDQTSDLLQALSLPQAENEKIELEFVGETGQSYDALLVLSEGHIRCLGLAILLAKNIAQQCPVVIFDDVVNAIDNDHRDGIWRTFFEDNVLAGKQVILTSHAEEFFHRIQQELGSARAKEMKLYKFLPHAGEHVLRVDSDPPTKNYVLLANQSLAADEKRDALRHARPALESLTDRLWKWLGNHGDGRLELKLAGPKAPWELNNKCLKLRTALNRMTGQVPALSPATDALGALLGVSGASIEWGYLNGGVHDSERTEEFDRATVRTIVSAVSELDAALDALQKRP